MNAMTCEMFEAEVSDWLDEELPPEARSAMEAHRASCASCAALVVDLRRIQTDARELATLSPSRDLWEGIEARIEAPVIDLTAAAASPGTFPAGRRAGWRAALGARVWQIAPRRLIAAAAALAIVSSGLTFLLTRAGNEASGELGPWVVVGAPEGYDTPGSARSAGAGTGQSLEEIAMRASTDREIERLRAALADHRTQLDSVTVATIERSLRVIDDAIAESRAALARDPANAFLNEQLDQTLQQKLELMRALAFAPSRS